MSESTGFAPAMLARPDAVAVANRATRRRFRATMRGAPCETCPRDQPDAEMDGALIGAGCAPQTNPRARGRLQPRVRYEAVVDPDPIRPAVRWEPRQVDRDVARQRLSAEEIRGALDHAYESPSACCKRLREERGERTIVYVNGIRNTQVDHCTTLANIANRTCARVIGVYNATEGAAADLQQVYRDRQLVEDAAAGKPVRVGDRRNPAVDSMRDLIVRTQTDPSIAGGRPIEIMAHSQGGAVASLALYDARRQLLRRPDVPAPLSNLKVTSFNAASPRWVDGPRYEHFLHMDDLVGMNTGLGGHMTSPAHVGRNATVIAFSDSRRRDPAMPFVWQELRQDGRPARGAGTPEGDGGTLNARHGVDSTVLPMYAQRGAATGEPTCPPDSPDGVPPPCVVR